LFPVAFAILWFSFLLLFPFTYGGIQPYQNYIFNAYFWLLVGVLFRLPSLVPGPQVASSVPVRQGQNVYLPRNRSLNECAE